MRKEDEIYLPPDPDVEYTAKLTEDAEKAFKKAVQDMIATQHVPARMKEIMDEEWERFKYVKEEPERYNVVGKAVTKAIAEGKERDDASCIYNWVGEALDNFSTQQLFDYLCSVRKFDGHMRNIMEEMICNDEINKINWGLSERSNYECAKRKNFKGILGLCFKTR